MENIERIAIALERIADALETSQRPKARRICSENAQVYLDALESHSHALRGRMTVQEISNAIGIEVTRSDQAAIGHALTAFGALKGKSGSTRYYVFD